MIVQKTKLNILTVEDDEVDRQALKRTLNKTGLNFQLSEAKTAAAGLAMLKKDIFDCVLLDYGLPDKTGLQLLQGLETGEDEAEIPVVMLTGVEDEELALRTLRAGAQDFLNKKGLAPARLARAIINSIERHELISQNIKIRKELKEKADFMSVIDDTMADGLLVTDGKGTILSVNQSCGKIFGYTKQQMLGENLKMLMADEVAQHHKKWLKHYLNTGESDLIGAGPREVLGRRRNGKTFPLEIAVNQVLENDQYVFVGCVRDVTVRKRAEATAKDAKEKLAENEALFRTVLNDAGEGIYGLDLKGHTTFANKAAMNILGYSLDEMIGVSQHELIHHHYPDGSEYQRKNSNIYKAFKEGKTQTNKEEVFWHKDGHAISVEYTSSPSYDENGKISGAVVVFRDISQALKDEAARREAEAESLRLGQIVEDSLNEIYVFDRDNLKYIQVNRGARLNLGYSMDDLKKMTPLDVQLNLSRKDITDLFKPLMTGKKEQIYYETVHQRKDGSKYDVEAYVQLSQTTTGPVFVAIIEDVTEKKAAADKLKQVQKMEAIDNLSGGIAHDFNNLLTAIQGSLQLLETVDGNLSDEARECLNIAIESAKRGADLTHRLLAFSRNQRLIPQVTEVNQLVRDLIPMLRRTIHETISIETKFMNKEVFTKVDTGEMEHALVNLAVNARDSMPDGGVLTFEVEHVDVTGEVAGEREITPGNYVIISVSDDGSGMKPEVREKIFEPFFTTKGVGKGTGLGLSMVYGFVKQSGGHVTVYSELDIGTTFKLYLKTTTTTKARVSKTKKTIPIDLKTKRTGTILLVEDDTGVRKFVARALVARGYTLLQAGNGPAAVKLMNKHKEIDMLLTDVVLPKGMLGPDIGKVFEKLFPGRGIIYSSGYAGKAIEVSGWLQKDEELLSKPYDLHLLFDRVHDKMGNFKPKKK